MWGNREHHVAIALVPLRLCFAPCQYRCSQLLNGMKVALNQTWCLSAEFLPGSTTLNARI